MEQIDVFDAQMIPLNNSPVSIDVVHRQGLWHQTVACWIYNDDLRVLYMQLRGPKNRVGPNTLDASASGHLLAGEIPEQGFREVLEELGPITLTHQQCHGIFKNVYHKDAYLNNEFCHIFTAQTSASLDELTLQPGEVTAVFAVRFEDIEDLLSGKTVNVTGRYCEGGLVTRTISKQDLNNVSDRQVYYDWVFRIIVGCSDNQQ